MKTSLFLLTLALSSSSLFAATTSTTKTTSSPTAESQAMEKNTDTEITRKIRDRLTDTDGLSMSAQNITIVTNEKGVTLQGEVEKQSEIKTITNIAQEFAGARAVRNQLKLNK